MTIKRAAVAGVAAVLAFQAWAPDVRADDQQFTEAIVVTGKARNLGGDYALTFNTPVGLPGMSLGAGTYVFRNLASNAVLVSNAKGVPYRVLLTASAERLHPTNNYSVLVARGARPDSPKRIVAVFAPGESIGRQFLYPTR